MVVRVKFAALKEGHWYEYLTRSKAGGHVGRIKAVAALSNSGFAGWISSVRLSVIRITAPHACR